MTGVGFDGGVSLRFLFFIVFICFVRFSPLLLGRVGRYWVRVGPPSVPSPLQLGLLVFLNRSAKAAVCRGLPLFEVVLLVLCDGGVLLCGLWCRGVFVAVRACEPWGCEVENVHEFAQCVCVVGESCVGGVLVWT